MHYRNGREAKEGDQVILKDQYTGKIKVGTIHSLQSACTSCNGQLCRVVPGGTTNDCVTVGECLHAEDAWIAIEGATNAHDAARRALEGTKNDNAAPSISTLGGCQLK